MADAWAGSSVGSLAGLIDQLTNAEAAALAEAVAGVLPLLRNDPERLRLLAETAVALDLHEAAHPLTDLATATGDRRLLLAAATLGGNPAVAPAVRRRLIEQVGADRLGLIRLDSTTTPATADETSLYRQQWPGGGDGSSESALAPVAVVDTDLPADCVYRLAVRLIRAGANVRRLSSSCAVPEWFGTRTVLVCTAPTRSRVLSGYPQFPERRILVRDGGSSTDREITELVREVDAALSDCGCRLRLEAIRDKVPTRVWDPEVYVLGAYSLREAAVLSGTSRSSISYLLRNKILCPQDPARQTPLLAFRQVVAVRTWSYLRQLSPKRVSSSVIGPLATFAGHAEASKLGVTALGRVLVDNGSGWVDVLSGEQVLDIDLTDIDDVFRPFRYGSGETLDLLHASENTKLHPATLHGTPHLKGHRISAKALAAIHRRGGDEQIVRCFPELEGMEFDDTVAVGERLLIEV